MHYYEVAPAQIIRAGSSSFTYHSKTKLAVGAIVVVEIGKKNLPGVIIERSAAPSYETKEILHVTSFQLPVPLVSTALWMSDYYACHLALVMQTILPRGILKNRRQREKTSITPFRDRTNFLLNEDQRAALQSIEQATPGSIILHGVTGSGKTTIYLEEAKRTIASGKSVIVLVPEINLTPQLVDEFANHFDDILLTHSRQSEAERHAVWKAALNNLKPHIIIGPRSALFMPALHIGLIVIDESHEPSFKQEQSPRYSAQRVATILARHHKAKVILGSATPNIADYHLASLSHRPVITMPKRARADAKAPTVEIIDMTKRANFTRHRFLSDKLLRQLEFAVATNGQALLFHNRRGSASTTLCNNCGWSALCDHCFIPFTLHADTHSLNCHICGSKQKVPTSCPTCRSTDIIFKGIGTKLIETEIARLFPKKKIIRLDGDALQESITDTHAALYKGDVDIIIGTQSVAKGLDLPHLKMVGVIQADAGLSLPDFGASERTFQLLAQVVGRVGRSSTDTSVVIQTYQPNHIAITDGMTQDYLHFYEETLKIRRRTHFPPFAHLLKLTCSYKTEAAAIRNAQTLARQLRKVLSTDVAILGPTPAFYERQRDTYRWQIIAKSHKRALLVDALSHVPQTHWHSELDPVSLL